MDTLVYTNLYPLFSPLERGEICLQVSGSICIQFFLILEFKTEVKFVYTRDQNKSEICIQKLKAKDVFVYSISSI